MGFRDPDLSAHKSKEGIASSYVPATTRWPSKTMASQKDGLQVGRIFSLTGRPKELRLICPLCGEGFEISKHSTGNRIRCKNKTTCGQLIQVPRLEKLETEQPETPKSKIVIEQNLSFTLWTTTTFLNSTPPNTMIPPPPDGLREGAQPPLAPAPRPDELPDPVVSTEEETPPPADNHRPSIYSFWQMARQRHWKRRMAAIFIPLFIAFFTIGWWAAPKRLGAMAELDKATADLIAANKRAANMEAERDAEKKKATDMKAECDTAKGELGMANLNVTRQKSRADDAEKELATTAATLKAYEERYDDDRNTVRKDVKPSEDGMMVIEVPYDADAIGETEP